MNTPAPFKVRVRLPSFECIATAGDSVLLGYNPKFQGLLGRSGAMAFC